MFRSSRTFQLEQVPLLSLPVALRSGGVRSFGAAVNTRTKSILSTKSHCTFTQANLQSSRQPRSIQIHVKRKLGHSPMPSHFTFQQLRP